MDVLHTAIWVSDLEQQLAFYTELFDLDQSREFTGDDGVLNTYVKGTGAAEIQFKSRPDSSVEVSPSGIDHLAIAVEDVEAVVDRAVDEWGSTVTNGPKVMDDKGIKIAFFTDPEGYIVEVIEQLA